MIQSPYVKSSFERVPGDFYPTIDARCIHALVETVTLSGRIVDCCAPDGSGIVDELARLGYDAHCAPDAFGDIAATWVVTNPPYSKDIVLKILESQVDRVAERTYYGFASLMRTGFDHAKRYSHLFTSPLYNGQIKLLFRPWWSDDHSQAPIHSFVWHIWKPNPSLNMPTVRYWPVH
jgi:hypothetical protein